MPVILPTITPETTPATELIRILYKQLCTRVVEKGCEFQSFKTIIERTHTIHSCLEKRITGIVQGNKFECSELMAYTKAVGLLEQSLCSFFFISEEIVSVARTSSTTSAMMLKWTEYKQKIDVCYKSLYRKEFETICSDVKEEKTITIEECFKADDSFIYEFSRKYSSTTEITKIVAESTKTLSQVTESSEITKTYGKEVVEVKNTMNSVKDILKSESFVKKKTENRQEYEAIKSIEQDITKLTGRLTHECTKTEVSEERKTKLKEEHWKATKEVIEKFKECVEKGTISVEEMSLQVSALTETYEVGTFKATTKIEILFRSVWTVRGHFFSRSCRFAEMVCLLKEYFIKEQNNNQKNCRKLEKCVEMCIGAIESASQSASSFKEVIETSTYTEIESSYNKCFAELKSCFSEFDIGNDSWRTHDKEFQNAAKEDKERINFFKGPGWTGGDLVHQLMDGLSSDVEEIGNMKAPT